MPAAQLTQQFVPPAYTDADYRFLIRIAALVPSAVEDWTGDGIAISMVKRQTPNVQQVTTANNLVLAPTSANNIAIMIPRATMANFTPGTYDCEVRRLRQNGWVDAVCVFTLIVQRGLNTYSSGDVSPGDITGGVGAGVIITHTAVGATVSALDSSQVDTAFATMTGSPSNATPPVITGTAQSGHALALSNGTWTNSPNAFAYRWLRDGTTPIANQTANSYVQTDADVGHTIVGEVTASNGSGPSQPATSSPTAPVSAAAGVTGPAAPTLTVTPGNGQNTLSWTDGSNGGAAITSHELYSGASAGSLTHQGTITTASPYVDTGLPNGTPRYYKLSAVNSVMEGPQSTVQSGTPSSSSSGTVTDLTGYSLVISRSGELHSAPFATLKAS